MKYLLAILMAATPLSAICAQASVQPLAANETLLQIKATGESVMPADSATLSAMIETRAESVAAARAANEAKFNEVMNAVRKAGVPQSVRILGNVGRFGFVGNEAGFDPDEMLAAQIGGGVVKQPKLKIVRNSVSVIGVDPKSVNRVRDSLEDNGAIVTSPTIYTLKNKTEAERIARQDAIAKARAEAEAYAEGLGMRVSRIIRLANAGQGSGNFDYNDMAKMLSGDQVTATEDVRTSETVWIDYALVPK